VSLLPSDRENQQNDAAIAAVQPGKSSVGAAFDKQSVHIRIVIAGTGE